LIWLIIAIIPGIAATLENNTSQKVARSTESLVNDGGQQPEIANIAF